MTLAVTSWIMLTGYIKLSAISLVKMPGGRASGRQAICSWRRLTHMAHLMLSLFGPMQVTLGGHPVVGFESAKVRTLLAYLALEADCPHSRDELAGLLWPEEPDQT